MPLPADPAHLVHLAHVVADVVTKYDDELRELRRDLHAHPELSRHEQRTTALVADRLARTAFREGVEHGRRTKP